MDALILSRIQFAANITFHILFPTITIALCWVLLYFKIQYNRTQNEHWMAAYRFWVKVFALSFALGVVSGITMDTTPCNAIDYLIIRNFYIDHKVKFNLAAI